MVLYKNTQGIVITLSIVQDGSAVDLTGYNAQLVLERPDGVDLVRPMNVVDPVNGIVSYEVRPDDFTMTGQWRAQVKIYDPDTEFWSDKFGIFVLPTLQD